MLLLAVATSSAQPARADAFPARAITIMTGFSPGGSYDLMARKLADGMQQRLGQPVLVTSRPGAGGIVMSQTLGNARPDGYTIGFTTSLNIVLDAQAGIVPFKADSVQPLASVARFQSVLVAGKDRPYKSFPELIGFTRKQGYAHFGKQALVDELVMRGVMDVDNVEFNLVSYKGGIAVRMAAMTGEVDLGYVGAGYKPDVDGGKLEILATTAPDRIKAFPAVPTLVELGYPISEESVALFMVPRGTPEPIARKLQQVIKEVAQTPEFKAFLENNLTLVAEVHSGDSLQTLLDSQTAQWRKILAQTKK
tara:strand:+ start:37 stop:960 length:924 start_codon:yes stop_codon:yes gene_type:complete